MNTHTAEPANAPALNAFLSRAALRMRWIGAAEGAAVGLLFGAAVVLTGWDASDTAMRSAVVVALAGIIGGAVRLAIRALRLSTVAVVVERRAPQCRNIVITAHELARDTARTPAHIAERVFGDAGRIIATLDTSRLFPARRALGAFGAALGVSLLSVSVVSARADDPNARATTAARSATIDAITVTITPPSYSALRDTTVREPARITALAGSRVRISVTASAARIALETATRRDTLVAAAPGAFTTEFVADADGFLALEPQSDSGRAGARRLIGVTVTPDAAPHVRVTQPGRDLFLDDARRTIDVAIEASDDLALDALRLRYTKVSGSGEQFTFVDGETPVTIARTDARSWRARGQLRLADLKLIPGDVLVYRGVAADKRPGSQPAESDAFIVEITAPGAIASEGFAVDDERDRYAISQQMVILKTQRLIARRDSLTRDALTTERQTIAAEQRSVRAEFVFMMGGELAEEVIAAAGLTELNEEAEAEAEDDILAGRLANQGRLALVRAIRSMSRAAAALTESDLQRALTSEQAALVSLQQAFSRTRYILRALTQRERLDLARRLTGTLAGVTRDARPVPEPERDARMLALRAVLADVATLGAPSTFASDAPAVAARLAERVLRIDPSDRTLADAATRLSDAGAALSRARANDARTHLERAAATLASAIRASLGRAPVRAHATEAAQLEGALVDELRRRNGASR